MADAQCLCGALKFMLRQPSKLVVACHCLACQRRTGSPLSVGALLMRLTLLRFLVGPRNLFTLAIAVTGAHLFLPNVQFDNLLEARCTAINDRRSRWCVGCL